MDCLTIDICEMFSSEMAHFNAVLSVASHETGLTERSLWNESHKNCCFSWQKRFL